MATTFTSHRIYTVFQGTPAVAEEEITFVPIQSSGTPAAQRTLTHPNSLLAPIVYFCNPDRTINFDQDVLLSPQTAVERMLVGSLVTRNETEEDDIVITERWSGEANKFSMPTFFFRQLYEYMINPPPFDATNQEYIIWAPNDKTSETYNVIFTRLSVGGGSENNQLFDINDFLAEGGSQIATPLDFLDDAVTGMLDRTVQLQFKIVNKIIT